MAKKRPGNSRVKHAYFGFLKHAKGASEATIDGAAAAIARFEGYTRQKSFKTFRREQAMGFKASLLTTRRGKKGRLSLATIRSTLMAVKHFFQWLAREPGFRSHIVFSDCEYFNLTANDVRVSKAETEKFTPTVEQIESVLAGMPTDTILQRRDRAVIAFVLLTGARDGAAIGFKLKHIDVERRILVQDAREVRTKRRKTFTSVFFPVSKTAEEIVTEWVAELSALPETGPDTPLFPATDTHIRSGNAINPILGTDHWQTASPIRAIFKTACETAQVPYFQPHSVRRTIVQVGQRIAVTREEEKAWSQNMGHEHVSTTTNSYGQIQFDRQRDVILALKSRPNADDQDIAKAMEVLKAAFEKKPQA